MQEKNCNAQLKIKNIFLVYGIVVYFFHNSKFTSISRAIPRVKSIGIEGLNRKLTTEDIYRPI